MITRRKLLALALLLPLLNAHATYPPPPADLEEPMRVLRDGIETLTGYMGQNRNMSPLQIYNYLNESVVPYFDFEHMAYWAFGPMNRELDSVQRANFVSLLRHRFLTAMAEQLAGYRHARIEYLRPKGDPYRGRVSLGVRVYSPEMPPVQLNFLLQRGRDGWKIYDVSANGTSAVQYYRNEFAGLAHRYGVRGILEMFYWPGRTLP